MFPKLFKHLKGLGGIAALLPGLASGAPAPASIGISIGGILLASSSLTAIAAGFKSLVAVGKAWRDVAPLFHENYFFSATMARNWLMGRRWPPTDEDVMEAHALCAEHHDSPRAEQCAVPPAATYLIFDNPDTGARGYTHSCADTRTRSDIGTLTVFFKETRSYGNARNHCARLGG